jgi:tetratricopeptide (TPR) repeat protein
MFKSTPAKRLVGVVVLYGSLCGQAGALEPDSAALLQQKGIYFYRLGDFNQAIPFYRRLVRQTPGNPDSMKDLLRVLWLAGRPQEAAWAASRLISISPNDFEGWNILWQSLQAMGRRQEALIALEKCRELAPDKKELELAQGRLEVGLKDYSAASRLLNDLKKRFPTYREIYPELAQVQFIQEDYAQSVRSWAKTIEFFPNEIGYRFHRAEALYYGGSTASALQELEKIVAQEPAYRPALNFLVNDAIAASDFSRARELLNNHLKELNADGNEGLLRLASLEIRRGRWDEALADAARCLSSNPNNAEALFMKAECLLQQGRRTQAAAVYQEILKKNPWSLRALGELADIYNTLGESRNALDTIQRARALHPTDPGLVLLESQYLFATGQYEASQKLPRTWMDKNKGPVLLVLLYHGLSPYERDPLLAYPIHRKTALFKSQIRALKRAGFSPVTAGEVGRWISGLGTLPPRPVLITFDDAVLNSFRRADPILKKYGFKATMFVPLVDIEGSRPAYASWNALAGYQNSGRWEMGDHGDRAHADIPIGPGRRGPFLVNKEWLGKEQRLETDEEWSRRVNDDHARSRQKMFEHLGVKPAAFAFPEGDFGQESLPNFKESAPKNLDAARKAFVTSYYQDQNGFNTRARDPMLLVRFSPPPEWTGKDLLRHIQTKNPFVTISRQLLRQAIWGNNVKDAENWLEQERHDGASDPQLWSDEARIHRAAGHPDRALVLARKAFEADPSEENKRLVDDIVHLPRRSWKPRLTYWEDNRNRDNLIFEQAVGDWKIGDFSWGVKHLLGRYDESGSPLIIDNAVGVTGTAPLALTHRLGAETMGHWLTANGTNTYSLIGWLESQWTNAFRTKLQGGRTIARTADTASALNDNISETFAELCLAWAPGELWKLAADLKSSSLSDNNQYAGGTFEASRVIGLPRLRGIYRLTGASTDHVSPDYYSPQSLQVHQAGFEYAHQFTKRFDWDVRFLTGYGKENHVDWQWVNDVETGMACQWTSRLWIKPAVSYDRTPTYRRNTYSLSANYLF